MRLSRDRHRHANSVRIASSLRADLIFGSDKKEVSPRAARYGGFDGKLKMASGRDRLIAGSILAAATVF